MSRHTLDQMIAEVGREIGLRKNVYPGFVARGKMRQGEADEHAARMESVLETLKWLRDNRAGVVGERSRAFNREDADHDS